MASLTVVKRSDDLDGKPADEAVRFGIDGHQYEIDLTAKNAAALRKAIEPFRAAARRQKRSIGCGRSRRVRGREEVQAIRDWARASGYQVAERGRVSAEIVAAYEAAPSL